MEKPRANRFDPHPNAFANQLIAETIIRHLTAHPADLLSRLAKNRQPAKTRHGKLAHGSDRTRRQSGHDVAGMD